MNVQHHVAELKRQLDTLYETVEQLQDSMPISTEFPAQNITTVEPQLDNRSLGLERNVGGNSFQHKDILFDDSDLLEGHPVEETTMSPDIQIKRLTAQLTVAYKRIAQLEEQLLSNQGNHHGQEYIYS